MVPIAASNLMLILNEDNIKRGNVFQLLFQEACVQKCEEASYFLFIHLQN